MNTKLNTKQSSKWNELLAKNVNGTYTVSNLASYNEIFIGYGYGWKAQMQEGLVIPYSLWKSLSSSGYLIRDATNGQSAYVKRVSDTQISITSQSNTNWNVYVWGR